MAIKHTLAEVMSRLPKSKVMLTQGKSAAYAGRPIGITEPNY